MSNLIENLGGYEEAKKQGEQWGFDDTLNKALLEYRRQHNIFEVGDNIVVSFDDTDIFKYSEYSKGLDLHFFENSYNYGHAKLSEIRHATDEEIKAGHRLA